LLLPQGYAHSLQNQLALSESRFSCSVCVGIFNSNNSHVWGEANLTLQIINANKNAFWSTIGWTLCMSF